MALPRELIIDEELSALGEPSEDVPAQASPQAEPHTVLKAELATRAARLDVLQAVLKNVQKKGTAFIDSLKVAVEAGDTSFNFDEAIAYYEQAEASIRERSLARIETAKARKREQFSLPASKADRSKAIALLDREIRLNTQTLESIRDLRWQLMALRAGAEPVSGSPVFSDPRELEAYLDEL
ncbi:MAG TPA: hypothetical protein VF173_20280 [Thermoanaerobaculia bacterium]|nr:hypothetical protein [Thermoanaerobaculia bacterium]